MSEDGKRRAESKVELKPDGGLFGPISAKEQSERRATQAFLKMLIRNPKRVEDSFVNWVDTRARAECGDNYKVLVKPAIEKRLAKNKALRESQKTGNEQQ